MKYSVRDRNDFVCEYYVEADDLTKAASYIAMESTIQEWDIASEKFPRTSGMIGPKVYHIDNSKNTIKIAYPCEFFESGSISQLISVFYSKVCSLGIFNNVKLLDIKIPGKYLNKYPGPRFGVQGIIRLMGRAGPFLCTTIKRSYALSPDAHAKLAYDLWVAGADIVKEDQTLYNTWYNNFYERTSKVLRMREKAEQETRQKKIFIPNVTAEAAEMIKRADFVKNLYCEFILIDMISCGFSGLQSVRRHCHQFIHGTRAFNGSEVNNPKYGISLVALAKLSRLAGIDLFNVGTPAKHMNGSLAELAELTNELSESFIEQRKHLFEQEWKNIKPSTAMVSGGIHPGHVPKLIRLLGNEIVINSVAGCYEHPDGFQAGIKAMLQSMEASVQGIPLGEFARRHRELDKALRKWGHG